MRILRFSPMLVSALLLAACGGGGGGGTSGGGPLAGGGSTGSAADPNRTSAENIWFGLDQDGRSVSLLILGDGSFWVVYTSPPAGGLFPPPPGIAGMMQGSGMSTVATPASAYQGEGDDFNFEGFGTNRVTLTSDYVPFETLNGTVFYPGFGGSLGFTLDHTGDYEPAASLSAVAGTYSGQGRPVNTGTAGPETVTLSVSTSGTISGVTQSTQCSFAGLITPRASGNVFDINLQFNGINCAASLASVRGVAYTDGTPGGLLAMGLNPGRNDGFVFQGSKP